MPCFSEKWKTAQFFSNIFIHSATVFIFTAVWYCSPPSRCLSKQNSQRSTLPELEQKTLRLGFPSWECITVDLTVGNQVCPTSRSLLERSMWTHIWIILFCTEWEKKCMRWCCNVNAVVHWLKHFLRSMYIRLVFFYPRHFLKDTIYVFTYTQ